MKNAVRRIDTVCIFFLLRTIQVCKGSMLEALFAAAAAPFTMTIGFFIWGDHWHGSAYALNLFKCTLASSLFFIVALCVRLEFLHILMNNMVTICLPLIVSSLLGILIGDNAWLLSLQIIGARRVIFIDGLKPFLAALCGTLFLNEQFTFVTAIGLLLSSVGIVLVCFEASSDSNEEPIEMSGEVDEVDIKANGNTDIELVSCSLAIANDNNASLDCGDVEVEVKTMTNTENRVEAASTTESRNETSNWMFVYGHFLGLFNVIFDVYGSVLTKQSAKSLNTWEINWIRFGFAAIVMIAISSVLLVMDVWNNSESQKTEKEMNDEKFLESPWYLIPYHRYEMDALSWKYTSAGVLFVTFLTPAMSQYALFRLDLGVALTLNALGPIYSLMLSVLLHQYQKKSNENENGTVAQTKHKLTSRVIFGTIVAFIGVAVLCTQ